ncbi:MAG: hypothetical protein CSA07_00385 [Bacteroidia bacterium]|nr:MAG: hypothetical protein CSA07_00385 [Bacteroidia bacterium]
MQTHSQAPLSAPFSGLLLGLIALLSLTLLPSELSARGKQSPAASSLYLGRLSSIKMRGKKKPSVDSVKNFVAMRNDSVFQLQFPAFKVGKMPGTMTLSCGGVLRRTNFSVSCKECVKFDMPLMPNMYFDAHLEGRMVGDTLRYAFRLVDASVMGMKMDVSFAFRGVRRGGTK